MDSSTENGENFDRGNLTGEGASNTNSDLISTPNSSVSEISDDETTSEHFSFIQYLHRLYAPNSPVTDVSDDELTSETASEDSLNDEFWIDMETESDSANEIEFKVDGEHEEREVVPKMNENSGSKPSCPIFDDEMLSESSSEEYLANETDVATDEKHEKDELVNKIVMKSTPEMDNSVESDYNFIRGSMTGGGLPNKCPAVFSPSKSEEQFLDDESRIDESDAESKEAGPKLSSSVSDDETLSESSSEDSLTNEKEVETDDEHEEDELDPKIEQHSDSELDSSASDHETISESSPAESTDDENSPDTETEPNDEHEGDQISQFAADIADVVQEIRNLYHHIESTPSVNSSETSENEDSEYEDEPIAGPRFVRYVEVIKVKTFI